MTHLSGLTGKTVLLLQGPLGPYFGRLAKELRAGGAKVIKVNFHGGDVLFFPFGKTYRGAMPEIPEYVETLIRSAHVDLLMLCGDCRPVHAGMTELAERCGIELKVFEEGYLRPDFVTCETKGVNGNSSIPRNPTAYSTESLLDETCIQRVGGGYWHMAMWATLYYMAWLLTCPLFHRYQHHRPLNPLEGLRWLRGVFRKWLYRCREAGVQQELCSNASGRFYIVPLQVHNDAQVHVHSRYDNVEEFIEEVIDSFAAYAPIDCLLVLKHHPMDRAYRDFTRPIFRRAREHGIADRVRYIHDQHLPTLFDHARGTVVINSTAGLAAIHQNVPTKVMGEAIFDIPGLTWQGSLHSFWTAGDAAAVDINLYRRFRAYLLRTCQINTSFYKAGLPSVARPSSRNSSTLVAGTPTNHHVLTPARDIVE